MNNSKNIIIIVFLVGILGVVGALLRSDESGEKTGVASEEQSDSAVSNALSSVSDYQEPVATPAQK